MRALDPEVMDAVDVHAAAQAPAKALRRVRAKLGEEHIGLIQTIRSVGYCFGRSHWGA